MTRWTCSGLVLNKYKSGTEDARSISLPLSLSLFYLFRQSSSFSQDPTFWQTYTYYCITSYSSIIPACVRSSGEMMRELEKKSGKAMGLVFFFLHNSAHIIRASRSNARNWAHWWQVHRPFLLPSLPRVTETLMSSLRLHSSNYRAVFPSISVYMPAILRISFIA